MYNIGKLCREFNLSRSTLLYYDKIGLLHVIGRTQGNYRQYSEEDKKRLQQICTFREAGVPLNHIKALLDKDDTESAILEKRLNEINQEISYLRLQQKLIVEMLKTYKDSKNKTYMDNQTFAAILKSVGFADENMEDLHVQFEKTSPDSHQLFLEFLGLSNENIKTIREFSRVKEQSST